MNTIFSSFLVTSGGNWLTRCLCPGGGSLLCALGNPWPRVAHAVASAACGSLEPRGVSAVLLEDGLRFSGAVAACFRSPDLCFSPWVLQRGACECEIAVLVRSVSAVCWCVEVWLPTLKPRSSNLWTWLFALLAYRVAFCRPMRFVCASRPPVGLLHSFC